MKITKIIFAASLIIAWTFLVVLFTGNYMVSHTNNNNNNNPSIGNSATNLTNPNADPTIQLTASEVAKHNNANDCWMIINNKVYDVTAYINSHPGGVAQITSGCGIDATQLFDTKGGRGAPHSAAAQSILSSFYLGDLNQNLTSSQLQNNTAAAKNVTIPPGAGGEGNERD
jgi:cytochrome b involved in lipid metabolism